MTTTNLNALAAIWKDDPDHTRIGFEVKHAGLSFVSGYFSDFDISVRQAKDDYKDTHTSISTGVVARDTHLRSPDFFNVEVFPLMTFKSTKIKMEKTRKGKIYGDLTLHGVTQRIELEVLLIGKRKSPVSKKDTVGVRLSGKIKRSKFDLGLKFVPAMIADDIRIIVDCEFTHE